jgi:TPP-dependent pyruvate/acetoin dehydrogenase alpha subunit
MGLKGQFAEDTDIDKMIDITERAYDNARAGKGPALIEISVHRWATHVGHDYEGPSESWHQDPHDKDAFSCPIASLVRELLDEEIMNMQDIKAMREKFRKDIEEAFEKASRFPMASGADFENRVYASGLLSDLPKKVVGGSGKKYSHKEQSKLVNPF